MKKNNPKCRPGTFSAAVSGAAASHSGAERSGQARQGLCPAHMQAGFCPRGDACPLVHGHLCQVLPSRLPHHTIRQTRLERHCLIYL